MCVDYSVAQDSRDTFTFFRSAVSDSKGRKEEKEQLKNIKQHEKDNHREIQWSQDSKKKSLKRVTGLLLNSKSLKYN